MPIKLKNTLDLSFKIERSNELNQLNPSGLSLTEIRFLAIYQAKINARKPDTRLVTFSLDDFCNIMDIKQLNITQLKTVADKILTKPVYLPSEKSKNGFLGVSMFCECEVYEKNGSWLVDIKCSERILPYMFEMKKNYFTYELWNALKLKSVNQIRMYEILKQYEKIGKRIIKLETLKSMLGLDINRYSQYRDFKRYVLDVCQKALEENTDIRYTYETIKGAKGKVLSIIFTITKNKNFKDDLRLKEFIKPEDLEDIIDLPELAENTDTLSESVQSTNLMVDDRIMNLYYDLDKVYSMDELKQLLNICKSISSKPEAYLKNIYYQIRARKKKINNLFSYTLTVINAELRKAPPENKKAKKRYSF